MTVLLFGSMGCEPMGGGGPSGGRTRAAATPTSTELPTPPTALIANPDPTDPTADAEVDPLTAFVQREDAAYAVEVVQTQRLEGATAYRVRLTSQTWEGRPWRHAVTLVVPERHRDDGGAVLVITGGMNADEGRDGDAIGSSIGDGELLVLTVMAVAVGRPVAVLEQVPNQPLMGDLYEDALIARTFSRYLTDPEAGDESLLLFPMVKAAARAMDAVQSVARDEAGVTIERFVVTGQSKRGWTTWLIGAVDPRVAGVAPRVIDLLNLQAQVMHQWRSYGTFSNMLDEYVQEGVVQQMSSPRGLRLTSLVDPFAYRERLAGVPKLVVLGANDPYWVADSSSLYYSQLPGEPGSKALCIVPNVGHSFQREALGTLAAFIEGCLSRGRGDQAGSGLPEVTWQRRGDELRVSWTPAEGSDIEAAGVTVWRASSRGRDFRQTRWRGEAGGPLAAGREMSVPLKLGEGPRAGWHAVLVQFTFASEGGEGGGAGGAGGLPMTLTTEVVVTPEGFPFEMPEG